MIEVSWFTIITLGLLSGYLWAEFVANLVQKRHQKEVVPLVFREAVRRQVTQVPTYKVRPIFRRKSRVIRARFTDETGQVVESIYDTRQNPPVWRDFDRTPNQEETS